MDQQLTAEVARRVRDGQRKLTLGQLADEFERIGYRFDRSLDAVCNAQYRGGTGDYAGESYPCRTLYPVDAETRLSAFHVDHVRNNPERLRRLQELRGEVFAVSRGYVCEV